MIRYDHGLAMSMVCLADEIARQYITRTEDAPVSGELMMVWTASLPAGCGVG
jgi:hypothetical protein